MTRAVRAISFGIWRPGAAASDTFAHLVIPRSRFALCGRRVLHRHEADALRLRCPKCLPHDERQKGAA